MFKDSIKGTFIVAAALCLIASIVVSGAAVSLKPRQLANKSFDKKVNILKAAGLYTNSDEVDRIYQKVVRPKIIDLSTGEYVVDVDPDSYDIKQMAKTAEEGLMIPGEKDIAGIKRRARYAVLYEVIRENGGLTQVVLPIHGKGLWSTLWGFIAVADDANTVNGLGFYAHAETPGLGGEVDNPRWKALWVGKKIYKNSLVAIEVLKGQVDQKSKDAEYQVDGLSGATITARGVSSLVQYWLGDHGYQNYLKKLAQE